MLPNGPLIVASATQASSVPSGWGLQLMMMSALNALVTPEPCTNSLAWWVAGSSSVTRVFTLKVPLMNPTPIFVLASILLPSSILYSTTSGRHWAMDSGVETNAHNFSIGALTTDLDSKCKSDTD